MKEAQKEQIKLSANFLNGLAIVTFTAGLLVPVWSILFGNPSLWTAGIGTLVFFIAGYMLHSFAVRSLVRLDD